MRETDLDQDIDVHIGRRLRARRRLLGLSQPQLASAVGVRFQQIQKYECGEDRISASRLWRLCHALKASADYFYEGLAPERRFPERNCAGFDEQARAEALDLIVNCRRLDHHSRQTVLDLARLLSVEPETD